jgi:glutamyl-tRNA synthetase
LKAIGDLVEELARKYALANAYEFKGKANLKAVVGKILAERPELKDDMRAVMVTVERTISEVNRLTPEEQKKELENIFPEYFRREKRETKKELPPLPGVSGEVVTRLPPEPNGFLHIGHGLSFFFNYYYARRYGGRLMLRFEDTNPEKERLEYYEKIKEDIHWLKLDWDEERCVSTDLPVLYEYAVRLIESGEAYVCECPKEKIKEYRFVKKTCECRERSIEENKRMWDEMFVSSKSILRLKGDMKSVDVEMRDPTLFRVVQTPHPIQKEKYRVWPTYDFECSVEDAILGITHVLRSNEFHSHLQNHIRNLLSLRHPTIIQYSRFNVRDSPAAKRKIKPLIEKGIVSGWDDVRLTTLRGLKRRGIVPETIHILAQEMGLSTSEPEIDWSIIEAINRKILDPGTRRLFFVPEPVRLIVDDAPELRVTLNFHPHNDLGAREIETYGIFFVARSDFVGKEGHVVRLKDLYNIKIEEVGEDIRAVFHSRELAKTEKLQWVTEDCISISIDVASSLFINDEYNPKSLVTREGFAERACETLVEGDIVQFERVGFARLDDEHTMRFVLAHR